MQKIDVTFKMVFREPGYFSEFINAVAFDGRQILKEGQLEDVSTEILSAVEIGQGTIQTRRRIRDILRRCQIWCDGRQYYFLCGVEGQIEVDFGMPLRVMQYEVMQYAEQLEGLESQKNGQGAGVNNCRFRKQDRLLPVVTFVLNLSGRPWTGYSSLFEMMEIPPGLERYMNDYKINLVDPFVASEFVHAYFTSALKYFFGLCKNAESGATLRQYVWDHPEMDRMDTKVKYLIEATLKIPICNEENPQQQEKTMCRAVDEIKAEGVTLGIAKGKILGLAEGKVLGKEKTLCEFVKLEHSRHSSIAEIMQNLTGIFQMSHEEAERLIHAALP